jgi:ribosomal protein S18 acetylase RimI-like enzyme
MKNKTKIYHAVAADAERVAEVGSSTFYDTWRPVNTEEDMQAYIAKAFAPEVIEEDLRNPKNTFLLAMNDENILGYAKLRRDRTYDEFKGEKAIEIERIYIRREFKRQGIGRELMDECLSIARAEKNIWLWLGVNIDNEAAIAFYKSFGFAIFGRKQFKLGKAVDDDFLMKLKMTS